MKSKQERRIPTKSWRFWGILVFLFTTILILTLWKDWWLTRETPNIWFYIIVPISTTLGGVICMYAVAKIRKQIITFSTLFTIRLGANTLIQVIENITKII
jgi:hypothetical protein